jgi:hypothetical protein
MSHVPNVTLVPVHLSLAPHDSHICGGEKAGYAIVLIHKEPIDTNYLREI